MPEYCGGDELGLGKEGGEPAREREGEWTREARGEHGGEALSPANHPIAVVPGDGTATAGHGDGDTQGKKDGGR